MTEVQSSNIAVTRPTWKVLVIDDDKEDYLIVKAMLKEARGRKFEVSYVASYEAAREALYSSTYDAVLVDYDLGTHSGIELIEEATRRKVPAPLILFTGRGNYEVDMEAMQAGATLYLTKSEATPLLLERLIRYAIERKQHEQALRDSIRTEEKLHQTEERFAIAFRSSPAGLSITRMDDGLILDVNDRFLQMLGYSRDEVIGRTSLEINFYLNAADRAHLLSKLRAGKRVENHEISIHTRTGETRTVLLSLEPVQVEGVACLLGTAIDISEHGQIDKALRESEARFRQLADAMPQLVWTAQPDGTIDYYNQRYQLIDGITPLEGEGWTWSPALHPDDMQPTIEAWQTAIKTGKTYQIEHRVRMVDGSYRWHLSRGIPAFDEQGTLIKWYGTATDIDDLRQAQAGLADYTARLKRSNEELENFAFVASHDLQEPLRKIIQFGSRLESGISGGRPDEVLFYLERIQKAAGRMQAMIHGLLELSRVNMRGDEFALVDLKQVANEVVSDLEAHIQAEGGQVMVGELPRIEADALQMRLLFQNLIGNAIKFHQPGVPPQARVWGTLTPVQRPEMVAIHFADNGIGLEPEDFERIFLPFNRLRGRSEYDGTGLGLAICHRIVERHHGRIEVDSRPGEGATFTVYLPLAAP
jgi:PAS domain S-box-containing protein